MHPDHRELLSQLGEHALVDVPAPRGNDSYTSSRRPYLRVPVPQRRLVARRWLAQHRSLAPAEVLDVVDSLFSGKTHEEKTLAAILLAAHPAARAVVTPCEVGRWLDQLHGWAEIDALCHNVFTAKELIARWDTWTALLITLARAEDVDRKRAALVFLVGPVQRSDDERITAHAFATIDALKAERDPAITKALSWLLRGLTTRHPGEVVAYLASHHAFLPKVAVRETRTKLRTGTKTGRGRSIRN
jgi:3-methyladenine DNA glycosylase AlkD